VRQRLLRLGLDLVMLVLLTVPAVLTIVLHWYRTRLLSGLVGKQAGIYVILPLVYLVWAPLVVVGFVVVADRLGYHYTVPDDDSKPTRRDRRRQRAAFELLARHPEFDEKRGRGRAGERAPAPDQRSEQDRAEGEG
jgi:hypothetical protein